MSALLNSSKTDPADDRAIRDLPEHAFLVLSTEVRGDGVPRREGVFGLAAREVFRDVAFVTQEYRLLHGAGVLEETPREEGPHGLGHAPDVVALPEQRDEPGGEGADGHQQFPFHERPVRVSS